MTLTACRTAAPDANAGVRIDARFSDLHAKEGKTHGVIPATIRAERIEPALRDLRRAFDHHEHDGDQGHHGREQPPELPLQ
jgi:hypothetical protein